MSLGIALVVFGLNGFVIGPVIAAVFLDDPRPGAEIGLNVIAAAFGVSGIPHLVVIGKDGTVKGTHTGADPSLAQSLQRDLEVAIR